MPRWVLGGLPNWMAGDGGEGLATLVLAALVFLVVEHLLFAGSAWLNHAEDEQWLRAQLTSRGYHVGEAGVVLTGGLMAAVWTAGPWFVLLFGPLYALMQRAVLVEPLRENAAMAAELVETNRQLEAVSEFKSDLMGMLAHEVGNPLASVTGYAEIATDALEEGDLDEALPAVRVVQRNADQIGGVLRDIVSLVETNPGGLTARPEPTALLPHLRAAAAAQPGGAQPDVHCPEELVALIQPGHLDQAAAAWACTSAAPSRWPTAGTCDCPTPPAGAASSWCCRHRATETSRHGPRHPNSWAAIFSMSVWSPLTGRTITVNSVIRPSSAQVIMSTPSTTTPSRSAVNCRTAESSAYHSRW